MRHVPSFLLLAVALLARPSGVRAEDAKADLDPCVLAVLDAEAGAPRDAAIEAALVLSADVEALLPVLRRGVRHDPEAPTGWQRGTSRGRDGVERPYVLFVPEDYRPGTPRRLLVDLHGGISRPAPLTHEELLRRAGMWADEAAARGWLLCLPTGQAGAVWWDDVGSTNVLGIVREIRRRYDVDENAVVATGFSDGASGCFYLALTHPTPFAGFVPLNGHVAVAQAGGLQVHLPGLRNRPLFVVNTTDDPLYPSAGVRPVIEALEALEVPVTYLDVPDHGHEPGYLEEHGERIAAWMGAQRRDPARPRVTWAGTADAPARVDWIRVLEVRGLAPGESAPDPVPAVAPTRVRLGIVVDAAFEDPGVRVGEVSEGSLAEQVGLAAGDVIVELDGTAITGLDDLRRLLGAKSFGDALTLRWRHEGEERGAETRFPEAVAEPVLRRGAPWGFVEVTREGNRFRATTAGIGAFELLLQDGVVDLASPVVVEVDGTVVHDGLVAADPRFLLDQAAEDLDRTALYPARLRVDVPAAGGGDR